MWAPPTPPHDDNDIYIDQSLLFLYEPNVMPETQLPPVYIKKEHKKPKIESITSKRITYFYLLFLLIFFCHMYSDEKKKPYVKMLTLS